MSGNKTDKLSISACARCPVPLYYNYHFITLHDAWCFSWGQYVNLITMTIGGVSEWINENDNQCVSGQIVLHVSALY